MTTIFPSPFFPLGFGPDFLIVTFLEKPFTSTIEEAEILFELAEKKNKKIFVFQNRRFDSDFQTVKAVLDSGVLGKIIRYEAHYNRLSTQLSVKKWKKINQEHRFF